MAVKDLAEKVYVEWFGGDSHTTRKSPSKRNIIDAMVDFGEQLTDAWRPISELPPVEDGMSNYLLLYLSKSRDRK